MRIAVTGATGFVGRALCSHLHEAGHDVTRVTRGRDSRAGDVVVSDINEIERKSDGLIGCDALMHVAGLAHQPSVDVRVANQFDYVNGHGTAAVARAAVAARIPRFVYLSSAGVMGDESPVRPFSEGDAEGPRNDYAASKLRGERAMRRILDSEGVGWTIVRPPLILGRGAPGNLHKLLVLAKSGLPLPFGLLKNERSYAGIHNLCEFLLLCALHPSGSGRVLLFADEPPISTASLARKIAMLVGNRLGCVNVPRSFLMVLAALSGHAEDMRKLTQPFVVNVDLAKKCLGWRQPRSVWTSVDDVFSDDERKA